MGDVVRGKGLRICVVALVVLACILLARLGAQERGGPPHVELSLGNGIPATLFVPHADDDGHWVPAQRPVGERPPLVVLAHGHSADQVSMSVMARSLARAGYATLTFDFRGHGANTADFKGDLRADLDAVVDWAETSPLVDGERIAVLGHSMGGIAVLEFASTDPRPVAVVPISGGGTVTDAGVPPHVLFLVAERDPAPIADRARNLARYLDGSTDVHLVEVAGTDHATILWSDQAIREVVAFLDPVFDVERSDGGGSIGRHDPRLGTAGMYLAVVLGLIALLGLITGRMVDPRRRRADASGLAGLVVVAAALAVTVPLMATGGPGVLPLGPTGQPVIVHLALAAGVLWGTRALVRSGVVGDRRMAWLGEGAWLPTRAVLGPGLAAAAAIFVLISPLGVVAHRLVPTSDRLLPWAVLSALGLCFFSAFEALVRRGGPWAAVGWGAAGRLVLIMVVLAGVGLDVLPEIIIQVLPLLVLQLVIVELFAAGCYAVGRDPAVIAIVESVFVAWFLTMVTPLG